MPPAYLKLAEYALFGAIGALIGAMTKSRSLTLPHLTLEKRRNGETVKGWDPGFLAAPFLGAALAMYFDTRPENAIAWGLAAGTAGPAIITLITDKLLSLAGLKVGGLPEVTPTNGGK